MASATPVPAQGSATLTTEVGVSGSSNFNGQLLVEQNQNLRHQKAFGLPGTETWGEWLKLRRTNPFVAMGLDFVTSPIRDARHDIKPADDSDEAKRVAEFVQWNLTEVLEPGLPTLLESAARGMLGDGFSLFERIYDVRERSVVGGSGHVLARLAERLPQSVLENGWVEAGGDLVAIRQEGPANDGSSRWVRPTLPVEKVALFSWQRQGNNYQGVSAFRPVWYHCKIQDALAKLFAISSQRESAGIPIAEIRQDGLELTPDQRTALMEFMANLTNHEAASAVMPKGVELKWLFSPGANKGHVIDAWQKLGLVVLQVVQAQQMVLGVQDTGSRSVGEVHAKAAVAYVQSVVATLEQVFNGVGQRKYTGIIRQLVDLNFGPQKAYPKLCVSLKRVEMSPIERANAVKVAVDAGLFTPTLADQNAIREELGFAQIDAGEVEEEEAEERETDEEPEADDKPEVLKASAQRSPWVLGRPLRDAEKHLALQEISDFFDNAKLEFEREAKPAVIEMLVRAQPAITKAMADGDPSEVAELPLDTSKLEKVVDAYLKKVRAEGARHVRAELVRGKPMKRITAAEEDDKNDTPDDGEEQEKAGWVLLAQRKALIRRMTARLRSELETEALDALRTDDDASEVVSRTVTKQLDSGAFQSDAGIVTTRIFNVGRDEAARMLGASEVEYSAALDSATCGPCQSDDGKRADVGSAEHDTLLPPNRECAGRDRCRCLLAYVPGGDDE